MSHSGVFSFGSVGFRCCSAQRSCGDPVSGADGLEHYHLRYGQTSFGRLFEVFERLFAES